MAKNDKKLTDQEINIIDIENFIASIDDWKSKEIKYEQFMAGITNVNWKVTVNGDAYFVKIYGKGT